MLDNIFNGMCGKIKAGNARLSINGSIAIKTSDGGYKTYNLKKKTLTKCSNFVLPIGDDFFFVMPTCKVKPGDIIIANGQPKCVVSVASDELKCVNYNTAVLETVLPERHIFMGKTYFYGKIVSLFGGMFKKGGGIGKMMKLMMLSNMMKGTNSTSPFGASSENSNGGLASMLPMMMMCGGGKDMFEGMLDFGIDDSDSDSDECFMSDDDDDDEEEEEPIRSPKKKGK